MSPRTGPRGARQKRRIAAPAAPAARRRSFTTAIVAVALAAAASLAYVPSFAGVFVFDDKYAILDNPHIKSLWPLTDAMSAPPENPVSGRPVASLTLAINYALAGADVRDAMVPARRGADPETSERFLRNVWGYHAVNLLLHVLAGLALFGVIRRTLLTDALRPRFGGVATPLAFVVALLWIVHPLTTDAVTYVCQRTEVLMGLFLLLTLYCAIRAGESSGARARLAWSVASIASCALGMGSKQTMVVAPLVVWLWDWTFASRGVDDARISFRRVFYVVLCATWAILAALVAHERWPHSIGFAREGWTPWTYLLTQTGVIMHYVRLAFAPWPLVLDYDGWPRASGLMDVLPYALLLTGLLVVTVWGVMRRTPWAVAGAAFFLLLAPSSSVLPLPTEIAAERRMYLPLAALVSLLVPAAFAAGERLFLSRGRRLAMAAGIVLTAVIFVPLVALTQARNRDFSSDAGIWGDTVAKRPDNPRARVSYGVALVAEGRYAEAEPELRDAVRLKDASAPAHGSLGTLLCMTGRVEDGIAHLERALAIDPEYTDAYRNLGEAYASQGRRAPAASYFARAVDVAPENPFLLSRLGWLLATAPEASIRDASKAIAVGEKAVRVTSRQDVMALDTLAAAYAEAGRFPDAAATARDAIALARRRGDEASARDLADRLQLYESGRKYREPPS
jgi:protein O-mannosyl-transferase